MEYDASENATPEELRIAKQCAPTKEGFVRFQAVFYRRPSHRFFDYVLLVTSTLHSDLQGPVPLHKRD